MSFYRNRYCSVTEEEMKDPQIKKVVDEWCDEIDKKYQPERSKREDKCSDPNHKEEPGKITCDTCFNKLDRELKFFGLKFDAVL